jgi:hypothetical protein
LEQLARKSLKGKTMSTYRSQVRDQRIADDFLSDTSLNCSANGCPNRWSYDAGTRLCTAHAAAQHHDWERVSYEQRSAVTERVMRRPAQPTPIPMSKDERVATLRNLADVFKANPLRGWVADLQAKKDAGAYLTHAQRTMLRDATGIQPEWP